MGTQIMGTADNGDTDNGDRLLFMLVELYGLVLLFGASSHRKTNNEKCAKIQL